MPEKSNDLTAAEATLVEPRLIDVVTRTARAAFEIADAERQGAAGHQALEAKRQSLDGVTQQAMRVRSRMPALPPREPLRDDGRTWELRASLPSELSHKAALRWPGDVSSVTGLPELTLKKLRAEGDNPRLYAIGRALFTTHTDLREWFTAHELASGKKLRGPTTKGTQATKGSR